MPSTGTTVLVLGAGSNVSQGLQKALALGPTPWRVVAACVSPVSAGLHLAERSYISPFAVDPDFPDWVIDVCEREGAIAVLSGVEQVLTALAPRADEIAHACGAQVVTSTPPVLAIGQDKLSTARWLESEGLPAPRTAAADDVAAVEAVLAACGWPLLAKPRSGRGGAGVALLPDEMALSRVVGDATMVVQEYLGAAGEEFSVGCVCDRAGKLCGSMALRRELAHGTTVVAHAGDYPDVREVAERIASTLGPTGPCNVQLRRRGREPVPFEINVRFSGTTPMRVRMGFGEVEAVIRHIALGEPMAELVAARSGVMMRYWNEIYADEAAVERLGASEPAPGQGRVEDWGVG